MVFSSVPALLAALGWTRPRREGVLNWSYTQPLGPDPRIYSASLVLTANALACRIRSVPLARPEQMVVHLDAVWRLSAGRPKLARWRLDERDLDPSVPGAAEDVVARFRETVMPWASAPVFWPARSVADPQSAGV